MSSQSFMPLTDLERDALAELSNISMARAASSLRQMIKNEVLLAVPSVEILTSAEASTLVAKPDNAKLVAVLEGQSDREAAAPARLRRYRRVNDRMFRR